MFSSATKAVYEYTQIHREEKKKYYAHSSSNTQEHDKKIIQLLTFCITHVNNIYCSLSLPFSVCFATIVQFLMTLISHNDEFIAFVV